MTLSVLQHLQGKYDHSNVTYWTVLLKRLVIGNIAQHKRYDAHMDPVANLFPHSSY